MEIFLGVEAHVEEISAGGDGYRADTTTSWEFGEISLEQPTDDYRSISVDFDVNAGSQIFLVVAVWSTGDDFGRDYNGRCEIISAHPSEENAILAESLLRAGQRSLPDGNDVYIPWSEYYGHLESLHIEAGVM